MVPNSQQKNLFNDKLSTVLSPAGGALLEWNGQVNEGEAILTRAEVSKLRKMPVLGDLIRLLERSGKIKNGKLAIKVRADAVATTELESRKTKNVRRSLNCRITLRAEVRTP